MALELRQQLKLTQQLVMTPQLQQAIKLLQLSRLELVNAVQQEMVENPCLEELAEEEVSSSTSEFINLGTNKGYSVLEVIKKTEEITGRKVAYTDRPRRKGDVPVLLASKEKAEKNLGWKLYHSDIASIIETAWNWHRKTAKR